MSPLDSEMSMRSDQMRSDLIALGQKMLASGLVTGTWGNVSCRLDDDHMLITPSGMDYDTLTHEDICLVELASSKALGMRTPSVESRLHREIYLQRPAIGWIIHSHSRFACTVASARKPIPAILDDLAQLVGGPVPIAPYALPGTQELVDSCASALGASNAVLLANHGAVCLGRTAKEAFTTCEIVEKGAFAYLLSQLIGGAVPLSDEHVATMRDFFVNKYGQRS
ncbi:MAG: class II aldolase/adducin family protein [Clostridia bacterium]|nr:class II aldolase/adducin family protein [Clostridia bacterium]